MGDFPSKTEDERTVEPYSDNDNDIEKEPNEEDGECVNHEKCTDYLKTLTLEQTERYVSNERLSDLANNLIEDFKLRTVLR